MYTYLEMWKKIVHGCMVADLKNQPNNKEAKMDISKQECWDRTDILWKSDNSCLSKLFYYFL